MKHSIALLCRKDLRKVTWVGLPMLLGAAVLQSSLPAFAIDTPAASFAQPQMADVIEAAQPAVVKIEVAKKAGGVARLQGHAVPFGNGNGNSMGNGNPLEEFMRRFGQGGPYAFGQPDAPQGKVEGLGSGFVVDADGYIVTNNHVIDGADEINVTFVDGKTLPAKLLGADPLSDLALLKVETTSKLPAIAFADSDRARVGDWVVAIGNPFGLGGSVTAGIISARGRDINSGPYDDYLQIDAPINSGNSGGPIIDASGKVVGVNTAIYSPNGGNIGIGFAIPAHEAEHVVAELREHGAVTRGWLGVQIQPITADIAEALSAHDTGGALVAAIVDKAPATRAGVKVGDIITRYGDTVIKEPRDLSRAVAATEPGTKVTLEILRNGKPQQLTTVLDRNAETSVASVRPTAGDNSAQADDALGLALGPLSPDARTELGLEAAFQGALVVGVKSGGPADTGGVQPGDIIVRVNRDAVADATAAQAALLAARAGDAPVVVLVRRGDQQFFTTLKTA